MYRSNLDAALEHIKVQKAIISRLYNKLGEQGTELARSFLLSRLTLITVIFIFTIIFICLYI